MGLNNKIENESVRDTQGDVSMNEKLSDENIRFFCRAKNLF